ncbi:MAG: helix-turn-helix domain-containing protein, partial [Nitrospira sp.]|nr:helix-turn-helix domain-containing protein [Nitrospira sp.]
MQHTKERQAAGIKVAKKQGIYAGRKAGTMKADPKRARALRKQGMKDKEIAKALGIGVSTVYRYLTLA